MSKKQKSLAEQVIYTLLQELGPEGFSTALHNASMHGNCFVEKHDYFLDDDDIRLGQWFDGIELLKLSAKQAK